MGGPSVSIRIVMPGWHPSGSPLAAKKSSFSFTHNFMAGLSMRGGVHPGSQDLKSPGLIAAAG